jgi:predicted NBD/HSP70 family sugar kinase
MTQAVDKNCDLAIYSILFLIKDHGSLSQAQISKLSGYSRSTVSINCEKLLQHEIIAVDPSTQHKKKNIAYSLNKDLGLVIGIGMGGTTCRIGIYTVLNELIEIIRFPIDLVRGPEATLLLICETIDKLLKTHASKNRPLLGIGLGIPSPVKYEDGVAFHPAFMPGWHLFKLKEYFHERYNCPVYVDNEVNAMALEEYYSTVNRSFNTLLCIKIGTGIGAGIIINGEIYRGENGGGGNIGHIPTDSSNKQCACGKVGCIECVASVPAIIESALEGREEHQNSLLNKIDAQTITLQDIKQCADQGDRLSLKIIEEAGTRVGELIGKMSIFLDPGVIRISGRATVLGPNYLYYIRHAIQSQAAPWIGPEFKIDFSELTEDSAATGVTRLCINELFKNQLIYSENRI